jgi:adenine phosphoribosyltransferase
MSNLNHTRANFTWPRNKKMDSLDKIKGLITTHPDFPKKGITFFDIHPIMRNSEARHYLVDQLAQRYAGIHFFINYSFYFLFNLIDKKIDIVVGLESRGYYLGIPLADKMGLPFVPLRKAGKLPGMFCLCACSI